MGDPKPKKKKKVVSTGFDFASTFKQSLNGNGSAVAETKQTEVKPTSNGFDFSQAFQQALKKKDGGNEPTISSEKPILQSDSQLPVDGEKPVLRETGTSLFDNRQLNPFSQTGSSLTVNGTELKIVNPTPLGNSEVVISGLRDRIANKTATQEDIKNLAAATGKPVNAVQAYVDNNKALGSSIEASDRKAKTTQKLVAGIENLNKTFGLGFDPATVLNSAEKSAEFLNNLKQVKEDAVRSKKRDVLREELVGGKMVVSEPTQEQINSDQNLLNQENEYEQSLTNHVVNKTVEEDLQKGVPKEQTISKIFERTDPHGFIQNIRSSIPSTKLPVGNIMQDLGNAYDYLSGNGKEKEELLNSQRGIAEQYYNNSLENLGIEKKSQGIIDNNPALVKQGDEILSQVDYSITDKYPSLRRAEIARRLNDAIARESGAAAGFEKEQGHRRELIFGANVTDYARLLKEWGLLDNPKTKDEAMFILSHPSYVADNSFFGSVGNSFLQPFKDLGMSIGDITGFRNRKDILSDKIKGELFPSDLESTPNSDLKLNPALRISRTIVNTTANLAGMMAIATVTEGAGVSAGLSRGVSKGLGAYTSFGLPSFDASLKDSKNFIDSEPAQYLYATINAVANAEGGRLLDLGKITRIPGVNDEFAKLAKGISNNTIDRAAAEELLEKKVIPNYVKFAVKYGKNVTKGAATMTAFNIKDNVLKATFGDPNAAANILPQAGHAFLDGVLGMSILGGFGAAADMRKEKNTTYKGTIYNMALNPDAAKDVLTIGLKNGEYTKPEYDSKVAILNAAIVAKNSVDAAEQDLSINLTQDQKAVYVANKTAEAVLRKRSEEKGISEETKNKYISQADRLAEQNVHVMDGLKFTPTLEPLYDLYNAEKVYNEAQDNFNPADKKSEDELLTAKNNYDKLYSDYLANNSDKPIVEQKEENPIVNEENTLLNDAKDLVNSGVVKGYTAEIIKEAANNNPEEFKTFLSNIAEQAHDGNSLKATVDTYGQGLVDVATKLFPKEKVGITDEGTGKVIEPTEAEKKEWNDLTMAEKLDLAKKNLPETSDLTNVEITKVADANAKLLLAKLHGEELPAETVDKLKAQSEIKLSEGKTEPTVITPEENKAPNIVEIKKDIPKVGDELGTPKGKGVVSRINKNGAVIVKLGDGSEIMYTPDLWRNAGKEKSTSTTESKIEEVKSVDDAIKKHDEVENYTFDDMVNDIEGVGQDNPKVVKAVEEYRKAQEEDRKLSGRGDMDAAEKNFLNEIKPPIEPPKVDVPIVEGEGGNLSGITHEKTEETRKEFGLGESYEKNKVTDEELNKMADEAIKKGYNIETLLGQLDRGETPTAVETTILKKYKAGLEAKIEKDPSDKNLADLRRLVKASDAIGSEQGRSLRARQGLDLRDDSLAGFFTAEQDVNLDAPLTEAQKKTVVREWEDITETQTKLNEKIASLEAENTKLKAKKEFEKTKSETKPPKDKRTHEDYVKERDTYREELRKAKEKHEQYLKDQGIQKQGIGFTLTGDMAKAIAKILKSHVEEGISKLEDAVAKVFKDVKDIFPGITEKDVHDIIAGEYNEPKKQRNEIAKQLFELRQEAELINKLDKLESGIEPKNEKKKDKRSKEIKELQQKIKEHDLTKLAAYKSKTKASIEKLEEDLKTGNFSKPEKKQPLKLDAEGIKLKDQLIKLKTEREKRLLQKEYENRTDYQKRVQLGLELLNVPRTIMASMDFSAPLRQGIVASIAHPGMAARAAGEMFKQAFSQKAFDRWFYDLKNDPRYEEMQKSKLAITDPHDYKLAAKEEAFMNNLAEKIPLIGKFIKGSERAYVGYLNKMRVDLFNRFADEFEAQGKTPENSPELYKKMAGYVNNSTGRGNMAEVLEKSAPILNTMLFSPRLIASRVNLLNPIYYARLPKELRVHALRDMAKFIGLGMTVLALAKLNGAQVEDDWRSTDFGKIKSGNTRWDIWGGFQPYIRILGQMFTGQKKATSTGNISELDGEGRFGETRGDVLERFGRGKLAPVPAIIWDFLSGKTAVGQNVTLKDEALNHLLPLIYTDVQSAMKEQGVKGIFTVGIPSVFGVGTNTYEAKIKAKSSFSSPQLDKDFKRTKDNGFVPSIVQSKITINHESVDLTPEQQQEFQDLVDKAREPLVKDFVSSDEYKVMRDKVKVIELKKRFSEGHTIAREQFLEKHPELIKEAEKKFKSDEK